MTRNFSYRDLTFRVRTDRPDDHQWLAEFLHPAFQVDDGERPFDADVTLCRDDCRYESLRGRGEAEASGGRDAFALDNNVIQLPVWNGETDRLTLHEEKFFTFFEVSADRRSVRLVARDGARCRIPLMRVLREYAMNHCTLKGGVILHASGVAFGDRGLLIVGTRNAGKTSLLTHLLRHASASYVANDRVLVSLEQSAPLMRGLPTIATIRSTMLPYFPELRRQLEASNYHHHFTLEECRRLGQPLRPWQDGRFGLTPAQFVRLQRAEAQAEAVPAALIFPRATHRDGGLEAVELTPEQATQRIPEALFGTSNLRHAAEVFNFSQARLPSAEELLQRCRRVAATLPCYELQLGEQAYRSPRATDQLVRRLLP